MSVGVDYFLGLGSQAEYGPQQGKIQETSPTQPTNCYGAAKLAAGVVLARTSTASQRKLAWLRLFSSYGPGDDPNWLIPYLIRTLLDGKTPKVTHAAQLWDYIHVDDVAHAIICTLNAQACGIFNLGSGRAQSLRTTIEYIRDLIDPQIQIAFGEVPYRPDQVMHLEADITALTSTTGWIPKISMEDGLSSLVNYCRNKS